MNEIRAKRHRSSTYSANEQPLYDEVSHKIDNNIISVKLIKDRHHIQTVDERAIEPTPTIDVKCLDKYGKITDITENKKNNRENIMPID